MSTNILFWLKKFVSAFLMPLPLGIALVALGLIFVYRNRPKAAKKALTAGIIWLFLFSYSPLVNALLYQLESRYPALHQAPKTTQYIFVLGSGHTTDTALPITSQASTTALARLSEGIRLYHQLGGQVKIIVSGYSGLIDPTPHALIQKKLAAALGIPGDNIIALPSPRDTQEEAEAATRLIGNQPFVLVTSASHMPRAMTFFAHEGLTPIPAPANHQASMQHPDYLDIFSSNALRKSHTVFHELLGLAWQKLKGL